MGELAQALSDHDLSTLRVIGEWYELDLTGLQKRASVKALSEALTRLDMNEETRYLPQEELAAMVALIEAGGRIPVAPYERDFGSLRQMGPARMEREEPWLDPISPAEALWYRGFLYRGFDDSAEDDLEEYYFLPSELLDQFPSPKPEIDESIDVKASLLIAVPEPDFHTPASTNVVDDFTALLAASQAGSIVEDNLSTLESQLLNGDPDRSSLLFSLAWELSLLRPTDQGAKPTRKVVEWLTQSREVLLRELANAWRGSAWNELFYTPGIICEGGSWENDPKLARSAILGAMPQGVDWYRLQDLIKVIKETKPDFQRPSGNYDTWYIRDKHSGEYLAGFSSWDYVEGRHLLYIVCRAMVWLGLVEISNSVSLEDISYRFTPMGFEWLENRPVEADSLKVPIVVRDDASILVPFNADFYHRFQIARVAEMEQPIEGKPFVYNLTPASLDLARRQGIESQRLIKFFEEASSRQLPASTRRAIERWAEKGTEGRLENIVVLRVRDGEILDKLRANDKTRPFIAETLGELAVTIRAEEWHGFRKAAAQLGLLLDYISADD